MKLLLNSSWLQAHGTRMKAAVRPPEILVCLIYLILVHSTVTVFSYISLKTVIVLLLYVEVALLLVIGNIILIAYPLDYSNYNHCHCLRLLKLSSTVVTGLPAFLEFFEYMIISRCSPGINHFL